MLFDINFLKFDKIINNIREHRKLRINEKARKEKKNRRLNSCHPKEPCFARTIYYYEMVLNLFPNFRRSLSM
jgi:hypothetical protein